jgi:hypothetical protein
MTHVVISLRGQLDIQRQALRHDNINFTINNIRLIYYINVIMQLSLYSLLRHTLELSYVLRHKPHTVKLIVIVVF